MKIKIDLEKALANEKIIVELGCGRCKKDGNIGIDKIDGSDVDIVADVEKGLDFLPDKSVDEIHAYSFLEHVDNLENLMREMCRVLKQNGRVHVFVPHFSNPYYYSDPTHKRFFGLYTFYYFVSNENQLKRKVPDYYYDFKIRIISQELIFASPFPISNLLKQPLGWLFNANRFMQEFFEAHLCYFFSCHGIQLVFTPEK